MKLVSSVLVVLSTLVASLSTQACAFLIIDEPKMPKSLLNK